MKKNVLLISLILFSAITFAQVSKTVNVTTAGTLSTLLTANEKSIVTDLIITGNLDARDFGFIRDNTPLLKNLNIEQTNIKAFSDNGSIYPENQLQGYAFSSTNLESIILPNTLNVINGYAFEYCKKLKKIDIPALVSSIEPNAFKACESLLNINVNENNQFYTSLNGVLYNKGLTEIVKVPAQKTGEIIIPNNSTKIGDYLFEGCKNITSAIIPNTVTSIGKSAFLKCGLTTIQIPNSVTTIGDNAFGYCNSLNSITIPNSVSSIGVSAFEGCSLLSSISIPNSVTEIGFRAFKDLIRLKSLYSHIHNPMVLNSEHFKGINNAYCTLYVPIGTRSKYAQTTGWNFFLDIVEFDVTALNTPENGTIKVVYNPNNKTIDVNGIEGAFNISIYNLDGRICSPAKSINPSESISVNFLNNGIYVVKVNIDNEITTQKIQVF